MYRLVAGLLLAGTLLAADLHMPDAQAEAAARKAMDKFMTTFNSRDVTAWAGSLNFPHVRLASHSVRVFQTEADFIRDSKNYVAGLGPGWDHSDWKEMKVVQSGPDKVHFSVIFVRYSKDGKVLGTFPSLYSVTLENGHWGVQARSSYAP